jgi:hypothetical protein
MSPKLSDQEFHELYCPVKNTKTALFLVAAFSVAALERWKGLHKSPKHPSYVVLLFLILVGAMLAKQVVAFKCLRERLVLAVVIVSVAIGEVEGFLPSLFGRFTRIVNSADLLLLLLGLLVSLTMLIQSLRGPKIQPTERQASIIRQQNRISLIALAVVLAILVLSPLIYLLLSGWLSWLARFTSSQ